MPVAAPNRRHQGMSRELTLRMGNHFTSHSYRYYAAPFDVRLYDQRKSAKANKDVFTVVQPDLCIICDREKLDEKAVSVRQIW